MVLRSTSKRLTQTAIQRNNVDEIAAISRISELEDRIRKLTQERNNLAAAIVNYKAFLQRIPRRLPPHEDVRDELTPNEWLNWATCELGYETDD